MKKTDSELACFQQRLRDLVPLNLKRCARMLLPSPVVPILCIRDVTLFAMQVGVYPSTAGAFILLGRFVGASPVTLCVPPQTGEGKILRNRWRRLGERLA